MICEVCGKEINLHLVIPADLWLKIRPGKERPSEKGLMCASCIMSAIEIYGGAYRLVNRFPERKRWWRR